MVSGPWCLYLCMDVCHTAAADGQSWPTNVIAGWEDLIGPNSSPLELQGLAFACMPFRHAWEIMHICLMQLELGLTPQMMRLHTSYQ